MFLPANITLKFGDSGDFVSELQRRLAAVHCFSPDAVNGFYDGTTVNGVSSFQSMSGIRADGIAGPETLRRLNGVISGDTSSTNHDEEQNRLRQEEMQRQMMVQEAQAREAQREQERLAAEQLAAERATQAQQWQHSQAPQQPEIHYAQQAAYAPQQHQHQQAAQQQMMAAEAAQTMQMQHQMAQAQQAAVPVHQLAAQPAQPLLDAQQLQAQASPQHAAHAPVHVIAAQPTAAALAAQAAMAAQQTGAKAPTTEPAAPAVEAAAAPKGIVGRAMQYANDMVQKLSAYFESKLPAPVIDEVKQIGLTMAKSGVKESAIPLGPEQQRSVDTPSRTQQPAQQRG